MEKKLKDKKGKIKVSKGGPYLVSGNLPLAKQIILADDEGNSAGWKEGEKYPLRRVILSADAVKATISLLR